MASCLLNGLMLQRELQTMLPSDVKTFSEDLECGDVLVRFETCGGAGQIRIDKSDRLLSLDAFHERYKSSVNAALFALWTTS